MTKREFVEKSSLVKGIEITESVDSVRLVYDKSLKKTVSNLLIELLGLIKGLGLMPVIDELLNLCVIEISEKHIEADENEFLNRLTKRINEEINIDEELIERRRIEEFHPLPLSSKPYNDKQQEFLDTIKLSNPDLFEMMSRQFRISNVTFRYYKLGTAFNPTVDEFKDWLEGLPPNIAEGHREMGFEKSINSLPFRRFYNELHDVGLDEYIQKHISSEDFEYYIQSKNRSNQTD